MLCQGTVRRPPPPRVIRTPAARQSQGLQLHFVSVLFKHDTNTTRTKAEQDQNRNGITAYENNACFLPGKQAYLIA